VLVKRGAKSAKTENPSPFALFANFAVRSFSLAIDYISIRKALNRKARKGLAKIANKFTHVLAFFADLLCDLFG
jgi:hypothetical protein